MQLKKLMEENMMQFDVCMYVYLSLSTYVFIFL